MSKTYDSFDNDYEHIFYNDQNVLGTEFFNVGISAIEEYGRHESQVPAYDVTRTDVGGKFHTAITGRKKLSNCRWIKTNEKWNLTYQIGFQFFEGEHNKHWWRITRKIIGTRSSKEPRSFEASDFNETQKIFDDLHREMSNAFIILRDEAIRPT